MTRKTFRVFVACVFTLAIFLSTPSQASAATACFADLKKCFVRASGISSWLDRTIAALDCELDFVECGRRKVLGR